MSTLPDWSGLSLEGCLELCRELVEDPEFPTVHRWREGGGKVLGHFQVYFPEEVAHAAGMLPVKVRGAQVEARRADSHFGSYLCSILRSSLEVALSGKLPLDMFVTHPICDAARNLAGIWGRNLSYPAQILYLPQNARSAHAPAYLSEEYRRLAGDLEKGTGAPVTDAAVKR
ncbi:MAG: 2-hydroxyacyl-CoA dehydratase family protein, partial [Candidatus Eremiobacterota bacterium]